MTQSDREKRIAGEATLATAILDTPPTPRYGSLKSRIWRVEPGRQAFATKDVRTYQQIISLRPRYESLKRS
jgi:hypothetical protein